MSVHVCSALGAHKRALDFLETGVTVSFEQPCRCWECNPSLLEEQSVLQPLPQLVSRVCFVLDRVSHYGALAGLVYQLPIPAAALCAVVPVTLHRWLDYELCGFLELFRPQEFLSLGRLWSVL